MPTKKPRFLVTIEPAHHVALKILAHQSGKSVSGLINEMLEPALAPLLALVTASWDPDQMDLIDYLEKLERKLDSTLKDVSAELAERAQRASQGAGGGSGPVPPSGASEPPASPTGEARTGRASIPRSSRPALALEALPEVLTPGSNTGVTLSRKGSPNPPPGSKARGRR